MVVPIVTYKQMDYENETKTKNKHLYTSDL